MLHQRQIFCPYCGEQFDTSIDLSGLDDGNSTSQYTEDCYVCCRPIVFVVSGDSAGELLEISVRREDE